MTQATGGRTMIERILTGSVIAGIVLAAGGFVVLIRELFKGWFK